MGMTAIRRGCSSLHTPRSDASIRMRRRNDSCSGAGKFLRRLKVFRLSQSVRRAWVIVANTGQHQVAERHPHGRRDAASLVVLGERWWIFRLVLAELTRNQVLTHRLQHPRHTLADAWARIGEGVDRQRTCRHRHSACEAV